MYVNRLIRGLLATIVLQAICHQTYATDFSAGFHMGVNTFHNDNIRLESSDKTAVSELEVAPTLTFGANTETTRFEVDTTLSFKRFDKSEFNSDDQDLLLTMSHDFERSTVGLAAKILNESTLTSELLTTGKIGDKAVRTEHYELTPNLAYSLNESNSLQLSATYATQNYHSDAYIGYDNMSGEVDWIHLINERLKWVTSATHSDFQSDTIATFEIPQIGFVVDNTVIPPGSLGTQNYSTRTKSTRFQVGVDYMITEQSSLSARLGRSRNDTTYPIKDPDNVCSNPYYLTLISSAYAPYLGGICTTIPHDVNVVSSNELDWTWKNERQNFRLAATQSTQPTGNGYAVYSLRANSNWIYKLTERDDISTSLVLVRNRASNVTKQLAIGAGADRDYASIVLGYQRQLDERWFFKASYVFQYQKYTQSDYRANANVISLSIRYQPNQWHWSR